MALRATQKLLWHYKFKAEELYREHGPGVIERIARVPQARAVLLRCYDLVLRYFVRELSANPYVTSVYAKGSMARGAIRPGQSDLDISIVIDSRIGGSEFIRLAREIRAVKLRLLPRLMPLVCEVELLFSEDIDRFAKSPGGGYLQLYSWRHAWGLDPIGDPGERFALSPFLRFNFALFNYTTTCTIRNRLRFTQQSLAEDYKKLRTILDDTRPRPEPQGLSDMIALLDDYQVYSEAGAADSLVLSGFGPLSLNSPYHRQGFVTRERDVVRPKYGRNRVEAFPALLSHRLMAFVEEYWTPPFTPELADLNRQCMAAQWKGMTINTFLDDLASFSTDANWFAVFRALSVESSESPDKLARAAAAWQARLNTATETSYDVSDSALADSFELLRASCYSR